MPVRSSVCTYSPSSASSSKYSTVLPTPSSLSVGHYKTLSSSPLSSNLTNYSSSNYTGSSGIGLSNRYSRSSSSYSPSLSSGSYSSLSSSSSFTPSSDHYRPLGSTHSSFNTRYADSNLTSTTGSYNRYSSASSTGSTSSSSLSSAGSVLDRSDHITGGYSTVGRYSHHQPIVTSSRRLSYTSSSKNDSLPSGVPRGLINLGNTCYMNSVIQSLYSIESFRNLILRASHDRILTSELADLFRSMKNSLDPVSPANFKYTFSRYQSKFSGLNQQDAQEFLRYLINGVHEECNMAAKRPRRTSVPRAPKSSEEAWSQYRDIVDDSPLVDLLVGQLCSTIVCGVCQNKSYCWDPFWDLSLPLVRGRHSCRLADVVQDFTAKETLDSDERPICSSCKKTTRSTKQISVCRLPKVMILHLKKFTNDGYKMTSPDVRIDRVLTFDKTTYTLAACISHHGHSSSSGHYTSHCIYSSKWFHFNDDRVKDVTDSFDSVKLNDAYVLVYTQSSSTATGSLSQSKL